MDEAYLFPTLLSALQAKRFSGPAISVVILCIGEESEAVARARRVARAGSVELRVHGRNAIDHSHVMFGRFFLSRLLDGEFDRAVYIDGDTQVAADLSPLFQQDLAPGMVFACRDPITLFSARMAKWAARHRAHCQRVGYVGDPGRYVNSGVLAFALEGWGELSDACLASYRKHSDIFRHPDQDALNVAAPDRIRLLSPRWNFPGFLIGSPAERTHRPAIYHFMSNPRPWIASVAPWGAKWSRPYDELERAHPELRSLRPKAKPFQQSRYVIQQRIKMITEYGPVGRVVHDVTP